MPLSQTAPRKLAHTRQVTCQAYEREDGLWDIEGHLLDTKPYHFPNQARGGFINAGEALHEMWVRLTLDKDYKVHDAEAVTEWSPFNECPRVNEAYRHLIGLTVGPGWNRRVKELLGGARGCTHLTELLGPMATTAFQAIMSKSEGYTGDPDGKATTRPAFIDSCHMLSVSGPLVKEKWPKFYEPADEGEAV